jgi:hypothetical protein
MTSTISISRTEKSNRKRILLPRKNYQNNQPLMVVLQTSVRYMHYTLIVENRGKHLRPIGGG